MDKYKISYIFEREQDINDIFKKVLNKELKKYIQTICKNKKSKIPSSSAYLSQERDKNC